MQMPDFFCVTRVNPKPGYGVIYGQQAQDITSALARGNKRITLDNIILAGFIMRNNEKLPWQIGNIAAKSSRIQLGDLELFIRHSQFKTCQSFPSASVDRETGARLSDAWYWAAEGLFLGQHLSGEKRREGYDYAFTSYHYHEEVTEMPEENVELVIALSGLAKLELTDALGGNKRTVLVGQQHGIPVYAIMPGNGHMLAVKKGEPDFVSLLVTSKTIVASQSANIRDGHIPIGIPSQKLFPYLVSKGS